VDLRKTLSKFLQPRHEFADRDVSLARDCHLRYLASLGPYAYSEIFPPWVIILWPFLLKVLYPCSTIYSFLYPILMLASSDLDSHFLPVFLTLMHLVTVLVLLCLFPRVSTFLRYSLHTLAFGVGAHPNLAVRIIGQTLAQHDLIQRRRRLFAECTQTLRLPTDLSQLIVDYIPMYIEDELIR